VTVTDFEGEVRSGERFRFGRNWRNFLSRLMGERIAEAELSLRRSCAAPTCRAAG